MYVTILCCKEYNLVLLQAIPEANDGNGIQHQALNEDEQRQMNLLVSQYPQPFSEFCQNMRGNYPLSLMTFELNYSPLLHLYVQLKYALLLNRFGIVKLPIHQVVRDNFWFFCQGSLCGGTIGLQYEFTTGFK